MGRRDRHTEGGMAAESGRYDAALAYVELDRSHRKRSKWSTVFAIAVAVLVVSLVLLGVVAFSYLQGQQKYGEIAGYADLSAVDAAGQGGGSDTFPEGLADIDWDALLAINPDTVAWLYIPGTSINYPVVRGADNEYYLTHDFNGDAGWLANYGAVFMDWRNVPDWLDSAYFIYGHHMNDGSMFADIAALADQQRFDECRTAYLFSPTGDFKLRTFSLVHCADDDPLVQISFESAADMASYIQDKMNRSVVSADGVPAASDITKSFAFATCDNFSMGRYVLYAYVEAATGEAEQAMHSSETRGASIADKPADGAEKNRSR